MICSVGSSGCASVSHEKQAYHLPVAERVSVTVLGVPSMGRCKTSLTAPILLRDQPLAFQPHTIPILRIGDAVVAPELLETRIADFFRALLAPDERTLRNARSTRYVYVLQDLANAPVSALGVPLSRSAASA